MICSADGVDVVFVILYLYLIPSVKHNNVIPSPEANNENQ
ncbi:Uncharacterised protein [Yersinia similis]|nr:Uncharacterised protein [Yersinia similis]